MPWIEALVKFDEMIKYLTFLCCVIHFIFPCTSFHPLISTKVFPSDIKKKARFILQDSNPQYNKGINNNFRSQISFSLSSTNIAEKPGEEKFVNNGDFKISTKVYHHDGWTLTYKHKEALLKTSASSSTLPTLFLIHPVGIGLSNWFWDRIFDLWQGEIYAPNLIGCGCNDISDDNISGDAWDPEKRGLFFPLDWVKGCETLLYTIVDKECIVVTQGGLAPIGVLLAHRDSQRISQQFSDGATGSYVKNLILASPPIWKDMITPVPESELEKNYNLLKSPILGSLVFTILETKWAIDFFSNLFLFYEKCDEEWLLKALNECAKNVRPPVMAFNAGLLNNRSFEQEMKEILQPTLVLVGDADKRTKDRIGYTQEMKNCIIQEINSGCNVLPWENAEETCDAIATFSS